jgi:hypothetical protein
MTFDMIELQDHLSKDCALNKICKLCSTRFKSEEEFKRHLEFYCLEMKFNCEKCHQELSRKDFHNLESHSCLL